MSAQKLVVWLAVALVAVLAIEAASIPDSDNSTRRKAKYLSVGHREPGDRIVIYDYIEEQVVSLSRTYNTSKNITWVMAYDRKRNGAYGYVVSGGPGENSISLGFKSKKDSIIDFQVEIYAI